MAMPLLGYFPELTAALGPPSVSLIVGAFIFGLCMQIADGCGSGTLYKAGLGIPMNAAVLPVFAIGSFLGSVHLGWWLDLGRTQPVGLVSEWGWDVALAATLAGLALVAAGISFTASATTSRQAVSPSPCSCASGSWALCCWPSLPR